MSSRIVVCRLKRCFNQCPKILNSVQLEQQKRLLENKLYNLSQHVLEKNKQLSDYTEEYDKILCQLSKLKK